MKKSFSNNAGKRLSIHCNDWNKVASAMTDKELETVSGGMDMTEQRESTNIIDLRPGPVTAPPRRYMWW
jgi:bacteriocin-like protein